MQEKLDTLLGVKVSFCWIGISKQVEAEVSSTVAEQWNADPACLSIKKHLIDTKHDTYRKLLALKNEIRAYWLQETLPSLDRGIRLLPMDRVSTFQAKMISYLELWNGQVKQLDLVWDDITNEMRSKLGQLFKEEDYARKPSEVLAFRWEYCDIKLPRQLVDVVYQQELDKFRKKMDATILLIEESFMTELSDLVEHLIDRLERDPATGERKRFKEATVANFHEFFERFKSLNISDNEQLVNLINQAQKIISGVTPDLLRQNDSVAQRVSDEMKQLHATLENAVQTVSFSRRKLWV